MAQGYSDDRHGQANKEGSVTYYKIVAVEGDRRVSVGVRWNPSNGEFSPFVVEYKKFLCSQPPPRAAALGYGLLVFRHLNDVIQFIADNILDDIEVWECNCGDEIPLVTWGVGDLAANARHLSRPGLSSEGWPTGTIMVKWVALTRKIPSYELLVWAKRMGMIGEKS